MRKQSRRRERRSEDGQTLAEFSLIAPIFFLLIFGLIDLGRAFQSYVTVQEAARGAARYAVTGRIECDDGPAIQSRDICIQFMVDQRLDGLNDVDTSSATWRHWDYPSYADPPTENDAGEQCDAVEVEVSYHYQIMTPIVSFFVDDIDMKARERLVNEPFGTCS